MDLKEEFYIDPELAAEGVWIPVGTNGDDSAVLVAPVPNPGYDRFMAPHLKRFRRLNKEVPEQIYEEALARHVLLSWRSLRDGGTEIQPNPENRLTMIRKYRGFKAMILALAVDQMNFRQDADEAEEKNS